MGEFEDRLKKHLTIPDVAAGYEEQATLEMISVGIHPFWWWSSGQNVITTSVETMHTDYPGLKAEGVDVVVSARNLEAVA